MNFVRGSIWYVEPGGSVGSEQRPGRPAIIVSNDISNAHSSVVEVVYLTTAPKHDLPTHVTIRSTNRESIALCEQITTVATERIGSYFCTVTEEEMKAVDAALLASLGLHTPDTSDVPSNGDYSFLGSDLRSRLIEAEAKCEILQDLYDSLLTRLLKA